MTRLFRSQSQSDSCTDSDTLSDDRLDSIEHASSSSEDDSLPENTAHFHHDDDNDDDEPLVPTFASLSASTRRTANDLAARLWSIDEDVSFVRAVKEANKQLPVVANLRCGAWYVPPDIAEPDVTAYFKSTDGHQGQWDFNLRRSNLHLIPLIQEKRGIILVDSTRRGKRYPDALAKTIPLWCATINRALVLRAQRQASSSTSTPLTSPESLSFTSHHQSASQRDEEEDLWAPKIWVSSRSVSDQERAKMEERLDGWAEKLLASSLALPALDLPLRPIFLHRPSTFVSPPTYPDSTALNFLPVICLCASQYITTGTDRRRPGGWEYVQGAGDDHELWAVAGGGWGSAEFWMWKEELTGLKGGRGEEVIEAIERLAKEERMGQASQSLPPAKTSPLGNSTETNGDQPSYHAPPLTLCNPPTLIHPTSLFHLTTLSHLPPMPTFPTLTLHRTLPITAPSSPFHLALAYNPAKGGITPCIAPALAFLTPFLKSGEKIVIACDEGQDASVGIGLVVLQEAFGEDGRNRLCGGEGGGCETSPRNAETTDTAGKATKFTIHRRLHWIQNARPNANPSRATLKRVNTYCMSGRYTQSGGESKS